MYNTIFEFIKLNFFTTTYLSASMVTWLTNTITITIMVLFIVALIKLVIWTFKIISRGMSMR